MINRILPLFICSCLCIFQPAQSQNVGIGTNAPNPSARLDVSSTNSGFLPPRMAYTQIQAIQNPAAGLIVWCTNCSPNGQLLAYNGVGWSAATFGTVSQPVSPSLHTCGVDSVHNPTLAYGSMTDQDGNVYKTIQIGTQTWMAENLKVRRYRNGDLIPVVTDNTTWASLTTGATSWYNNDSATFNCPYGKLYNWYAVADARNVCPTGWHLPSDAEFTTLTNFLGGESVAGGKMKTTGTQYWIIPNASADNSSGWSGVPGGDRDLFGVFDGVGTYASWWGSTDYSPTTAWGRVLQYVNGSVGRGYSYKERGFSVRCLRD